MLLYAGSAMHDYRNYAKRYVDHLLIKLIYVIFLIAKYLNIYRDIWCGVGSAWNIFWIIWCGVWSIPISIKLYNAIENWN